MKRISTSVLIYTYIILGSVSTHYSYGINTKDTRMLAQPAISAGTILHLSMLKICGLVNSDGSQPRRLTVDEGIESDPWFSPDGKLIAFSAQYDGNTDVFIIPVEGGIPTRLTWHPGTDLVKRIHSGRKESSFCLTAVSILLQILSALYRRTDRRISRKT